MSHTPGPWRVSPYYKHEVVSDHGVICCAPNEIGQTRINARLIAAAPELLFELEMADRHIRLLLKMLNGEHRKVRVEIDAVAERVPQRQAVITKAEGNHE